jgi:hypothetical protein
VAGDISRRKKVKEKRPSPFLFPLLPVAESPVNYNITFHSTAFSSVPDNLKDKAFLNL